MPIITQPAPLPVSGQSAPQPQPRQPDINEAPAEAKPQVKEQQVSPKWAALARREKALRAEAQALKAERDAMKAKESEYATKYIPKDSLAQRAKQDALGLLQEFGITPDEFTQQLLNANPADHAIRKLEAKIQELENANKQTVSKLDEQQQQAYDQAVHQIRNEAKLLIDADPSYETIKATNSTEAVVELIKETFNKDGTLLSVEEAAKEVENYLIEEAMKLTQLKKIKEKLTPTPVAEKLTQPPLQKQAIRTLTHAQTPSTKPRLTEKERRERAIAAFMGQLK